VNEAWALAALPSFPVKTGPLGPNSKDKFQLLSPYSHVTSSFTYLGKGLNLSYQNSEPAEVLVKTLTGYQKTKILAIPLTQDLVNSAPCNGKACSVSF
jgi:hypothetical protein